MVNLNYNQSNTLWAVVLSLFGAIALPSNADEFNAKVKPILSQHCFACHGQDAKQRKGELRLDVPQSEGGLSAERLKEIFGGGHTGSLIFERISTQDLDDRMPPEEKPALSPSEIAVLAQWLDDGASYTKHWAFVSPTLPEVPSVKQSAWPKNNIDHFVLGRLEAANIAPAPIASPETRLRRVYLDIIGILPSLEQREEFLGDPSDVAYARVVDELLASPHFGERWGRHWLDGARYADSNGYSIDGSREIWPYRDWVVSAINADMPFDQFMVEQLAGDLLPNATRAQRVATGFHRNTMINQEGGIDKEEFRIESIVNRVNTTGAVFLGLTMECAKCHDHKYDPVYQKEYYNLFAFLNNDDEINIELPSPDEKLKIDSLQKEINAFTPKRNAYRAVAIQEPLNLWLAALSGEAIKGWGLKEKAAIEIERSTWSDEQEQLIQKRFLGADTNYQNFEKALGSIRAKRPKVPKTMVLRKRGTPRETRRFEQGDFTRLAETVLPGTPSILHPYQGPEMGSRLDLAKWIADPQNPLTPRVTVNRYWQYLFGLGLVETENDFGNQGSLPTHPELLDYIAYQFIARDWSVKACIREIVLSATYQQSSHRRSELDIVDPENHLLARQNRVRLDAEIIRDVTLSASGKLDRSIGGPSVYPPQPDGVMKLGQSAREWKENTDGNRFRRGLYTFFWRATPYPSLMAFDAPDAMISCTRRSRSNTPLQALTLLNDLAFIEQAEALAQRIEKAPLSNDEEKLHYAFQICLGRSPQTHEVSVLTALLQDTRKQEASDDNAGDWFPVARTLLNLDEFITRE